MTLELKVEEHLKLGLVTEVGEHISEKLTEEVGLALREIYAVPFPSLRLQDI